MVSMGNVNDHMKGAAVVVREAVRGNYLAEDFPGWGAPNYEDFLVPLTEAAGLSGIVTSVNSHGSNPWTRYSIRLENGGYIIDGVPGNDFDWK